MSDQQDKTEEASPFKLQDARKKGQVPRSQELLSFAMLLAFLLAFSSIAVHLAGVIASHSHWWLSNADLLGADRGYFKHQARASLGALSSEILPLLAALLLTAVLANLLYSGPVFSSVPLKPDFKRLNPIAGLKRIFSRRMFVEVVKVLVKGLLFALVLYFFSRHLMVALLGSAMLSPFSLPSLGMGLLMRLGFTLLAVLAIAALFEMWYSRRDFARQMRMTKHEQKDEYRRREGDPEIRSRRKGIQQELLKKVSALGQVKDADFVVVNPTHYAVALKYRPSSMRAPCIVAMGRGVQAARICHVARRHGVPIVRRPPLARALSALGRHDSPIPDSMHEDVASIYRWIVNLPGNKVMQS